MKGIPAKPAKLMTGIFFTVLLCSFLFSSGQTDQTPRCATQEHFLNESLKDPRIISEREEIERKSGEWLQSSEGAQNRETVIIPVVVHVVYNTPEQNISEAQVLSQIEVLNEDFARSNPDASLTPSAFQSVAAGSGIQFTLAKRDPSGNSSNGITRTYTTVTSFTSDGKVKMSAYGGKDGWPSDQYLNIWVCNLGLLGYATYPGGNPIADGVVVKYNAFGRTGTLQTAFNKGRTATHEVGHWLNLYHIWGDAFCGDDLLSDTPKQERANSGCPAFPHVSSCSPNSAGDMFMNYMDYSHDGCMNMFTQGQVSKMTATLNVARASLKTSMGGVSPSSISCNVPTGLNVSTITTSSAVLSWTSNGSSSYNIRYKAVSSTIWNSSSSTVSNKTLSGLSPATSYEFQVQSVCSGSASGYSGSYGFTTSSASACSLPSGLNSSGTTSTQTSISWGSTGAASYNVRYKPSTVLNWTNVTGIAGTSLLLQNLNPATNYEFQVEGVCGSVTSGFSPSSGFTTAQSNFNLVLGTGSVISGNTPYATSYYKEKVQIIISRDELLANGFNAATNQLNSLSFYVVNPGQMLKNLTIKIQHTSLSGFTGTSFSSTGSSVLVYSSNHTPSGGWNKHDFIKGFTYNGNDNLLVDISWSNSTRSVNTNVNCTSTSNYKVLYYGSSASKGGSNFKNGTLTFDRPNMKLEFTSPVGAKLETVNESLIVGELKDIKVYPNPASTFLNVSFENPGNQGDYSLLLYDFQGKLVKEIERIELGNGMNNYKIDLALDNINAGIYLCSMQMGKITINKKVLILGH